MVISLELPLPAIHKKRKMLLRYLKEFVKDNKREQIYNIYKIIVRKEDSWSNERIYVNFVKCILFLLFVFLELSHTIVAIALLSSFLSTEGKWSEMITSDKSWLIFN